MPLLPIPGFDGYLVDETGAITGRWGRPISTYVDRDGYLRVTLAKGQGAGAKRIHRAVHQIVCAAFHGEAQALEVRHLDGNRRNNKPENLAWGTRQENSDDRITHGTVPTGEASGAAKLTTSQVSDIRFFLASDISQRVLADWFGVSQANVWTIANHITWRATMAKKPTTYDALFPGRFLKAGLFEGKQVTLTVKDANVEELEGDDGKKLKAILAFHETDTQLVLCKTNGICIKAMFGNILADWYGKKVTFFPSTWNGEPAIRVWGSPEIEKDMPVSVQLPRRKPVQMVMHKVEAKQAAAPAA